MSLLKADKLIDELVIILCIIGLVYIG